MGELRPAAAIIDELIVLKVAKCWLVATPGEVASMIKADPARWAKAIGRGKSLRRMLANARRCAPDGRSGAIR